MARKPNVLIIVTDQQRADTIAALGNPIIKTPTLDRLCNEGTAFRRAYTPTPVCGPARASMGCGRPGHQGCMTDNFGGVFLDYPDFPTMLHQAGYQTLGVGKSHSRFAGGPDKPTPENLQGFDRFVHTGEYFEWFSQQSIDWIPRAAGGFGTEHYYIPETLPYPHELSKPHWIVEQSRQFLADRDTDKPFLVCAHFGAPHPGFHVPYPWSAMYRPIEFEGPHKPANYRDYRCRANLFQNRYKWMEDAVEGDRMLLRQIQAAYSAEISYLDWQFARLLEALGDEIDNTLILFTTDHGEMLGDYGCVGKRCMLEAAVRIPMIARLPGVFEAGKEVRAPSTLLDIMPTVVSAAGQEIPHDLDEALPLQEVAGMEAGERIVFSQFSRAWNGQYYASDGERAYWHSAADKREWNFRLCDELDQGPILHMDERGKQLKQALIDRHRGDVFSRAVEADDWADHDIPANNIHRHPDYGVLFAEKVKGKIQADVDALGPGYARKCTGIGQGHPMAEHMVTLTDDERSQLREIHAEHLLTKQP
jgi:arylsulfatase A-like enzyme